LGLSKPEQKSALLQSYPIALEEPHGKSPDRPLDLVFVHKPAGMNTHRPDSDKPGLVEFAQAQLGVPLYIVHRLDKGTSGVLIFSKSANAAEILRERFENGKIQKEYLFLTDSRGPAHSKSGSGSQNFEISSEIIKNDEGKFISVPSKNPNSRTTFQKLKEGPRYTLWQARPSTGKPHQIRLHAETAGIPVLGDLEHGGSPFFRLCLHAHKLSLPEIELTSPTWMNENITDSPEFHLEEALWKRKYFLPMSEVPTGRIVHTESPYFRLDQYGEQLWMGWYGTTAPDLTSPLFLALFECFRRPLWIRQMKPRGGGRGAGSGTESFLLSQNAPKAIWNATENGLLFELRANQGLSPGLFLDQRENRAWVRQHSKDRRVLNLFAYTGGFSLNAWAGEAREVCTVDVSKPFMEWTKHNFQLNKIQLDTPGLEFWIQDCLLFLGGCQKRKRKFDLIICDPPTLGRTKTSTFDLKRDLQQLLKLCWSLLDTQGEILFSCNYEGWTRPQLTALILQFLGPECKIQQAPGSPLDFEVSPHESLMKSLILSRGPTKIKF
jgi:23S rRNA (cytosine1962-C5)-methyltransferase